MRSDGLLARHPERQFEPLIHNKQPPSWLKLCSVLMYYVHTWFRRGPLGTAFLLALFVVPVDPQITAVQEQQKCAIEGSVTNATVGSALARVNVHIFKKGMQESLLVTTTDASGQFIVEGLAPGHYFLSAERTGFVSQVYGEQENSREGVTVSLAPGQKLREIDFRLIATGVITGRVSGADNEPRVGADVRALRFRYVQGRGRLAEVGHDSTNDLGEYRIFGLPPGHYYVGAFDQWWQRGVVTIRRPKDGPPEQRYASTLYPNVGDPRIATVVSIQPGGEIGRVDIITPLSPTYHLRGKILTGQIVDSARVQLDPVDEMGSGGGEIAADAHGNFDFSGLFQGSYILSTVFGREGRLYSAWRRVEVVNADADGVTLTPNVWMELKGRVLTQEDAKIDLSKLNVDLQPSPLSPLTIARPSTRVNSDGRFLLHVGHDAYEVELSGLPEDFYVKSIRSGDEETANRSIDLSIAEAPVGSFAIVVSGSGARIDGVVKTEEDKPVSGALVTLVPDASHRNASYLFKERTTDPDGSFTIRGVPPGEYNLNPAHSPSRNVGQEADWRPSEAILVT